MRKEFPTTPHILIVEGRIHAEIVDELTMGAKSVLTESGCTFDLVQVPSVFEIAAAIKYAIKAMQVFDGEGRYHGFVALGAVIPDKNGAQDHIYSESIRALQNVATKYSLAIGQGIMRVATEKMAIEKASPDGENTGGVAAEACLEMLWLKHRFGLHLR